MITNAGDDESIHFQKDQITFNNNALYKQKVKGYDFNEIQNAMEKGLTVKAGPRLESNLIEFDSA